MVIWSCLPCYFCSFVQVEVEGQKVTWLTPHALQQVVPEGVDYNIMLTFLEFYEVSSIAAVLESARVTCAI